jgi:signal transduction histidine kinase
MELQQELQRLRQVVEADLSIYGPDGSLLTFVGDPLPRPDAGVTGWFAGPETRPVVALRLDDDRTLVAAPSTPLPEERPELVALMLFAPMVLLATYFLARRMTRRIEKLKTGVDRLGGGDLDARVQVEGADEISDLARGFNRTADRIQQLVGAQRSVMALVSHELRSPLARLRMAIELLAERPDPKMQRQARRDIAELDELIEQILLASRLRSDGAPERKDKVDLLALSAEEGARVGADVAGRPVQVEGDAVYLRRLLRNLFENARRHGKEGTIEAKVDTPSGETALARITVSDRGPGVPEPDREKIFEPFYRVPGPAEKAKSGIGLGLALVRQIARHHGGEVRCLPREGGGTTFQVDLPI